MRQRGDSSSFLGIPCGEITYFASLALRNVFGHKQVQKKDPGKKTGQEPGLARAHIYFDFHFPQPEKEPPEKSIKQGVKVGDA